MQRSIKAATSFSFGDFRASRRLDARTSKLAIRLFVAISFSGSWAILAVYSILGGTWQGPSARAVGVLYMLPPGLAALVVQGPILRESLVEPLGIRLKPGRWLLVAWLLPLAIVLLTVALSSFWPGMEIASTREKFLELNRIRVPAAELDAFIASVRKHQLHPMVSFVGGAMIAGITVNTALTLFEELGWRGFLFEHVNGDFWRKSLVGGTIWGVWQLPLVLRGHYYPTHPYAGLPLILLWSISISPLIALVRLQSASVIAAAVFRGTLMALSPVPILLVQGGSEMITTVTGVSGLLATLIVLLIVLRMRRPEKPSII